jgi:hypothetical protein
MRGGFFGRVDQREGVSMRLVRVFVLAVALSGGLFGASEASAQTTNSLSIAEQSTIAFKGLAVNVTLDIVCDPSLNIAFGNATVAEVSGHKVAQGTGFFQNDFPGVPCTGSTETVTLTVATSSGFAFKHGSGIASADVTLFDPLSFSFTDITAGPTAVRITK